MKYKYMVTYMFAGAAHIKDGLGRVFVTLDDPLESEEAILKAEELIRKGAGFDRVSLLNIVKLKK